MQGYIYRLQETASQPYLRRLQKEASRKLIRATNILRPREADYWPNTLEEFASFAVENHPETADFLSFFVLHASTPTASVTEFCARLQRALQWMQQQQRQLEL